MNGVIFRGIEGSNPLGFLAGLGALRLFDLMWPRRGIQLKWSSDGGWRPELIGAPVRDEVELCTMLANAGPWAPLDKFERLGNNLTVARAEFARVVCDLTAAPAGGDRRARDFAAAFGSEIFRDKDKDRIAYTDLCFITGSGHQHFLGTALGLRDSVKVEHLREALFGPWRYQDKGMSMRWDPDDAKEYALRWRDPSVGGVFSIWGANRLAFEALPLFPTVPTGGGLRTTGFYTRQRSHEFTWPIWTQPASVDTVRSLVGLRELEQENPERARLQIMGIDQVFRVQRVRIGQGANFKVSFRPARAV